MMQWLLSPWENKDRYVFLQYLPLPWPPAVEDRGVGVIQNVMRSAKSLGLIGIV